jgi:transposase InsO family protein
MLLAALAASGQTQAAFCAEHHVSTATLCAWRRALRAHGDAGLEPRTPRRNARGITGPPRSAEERRAVIEAFQRAGLTIRAFARTWGLSEWTLRGWLKRFREQGPRGLEPQRAGRPKGSGGFSSKPAAVRAEVIRTKLRFPLFGWRKVRDFLRRFQGVEVSTGTVARMLKDEGFAPQPVVKKRRRSSDKIRRFERAHPGELWQSDITSFVLRRHGTRVYLTVFLDDFSRYVVSWALSTAQRGSLVVDCLMDGIARHGKPKEVLTDQGRQYFAWRGKSEFQRVLVREGIAHVVSRAHHPETLGKCERLWETVGREFWQRAQPQELSDARERLGHYFAHYNFFRPHQGIGGLVPADRFFAAEDPLRRTLLARLSDAELKAALDPTPRKSVYLFGQVGDEQVSVVGERGELIVKTSSGVRQRIGLDELGMPPVAAQKEQEEQHDEEDGQHGRLGVEHDAGQHPERVEHGLERVEQCPDPAAERLPAAGTPAADGQETPEVRAPAALPARSEGAVAARHGERAGASAPLVRADPLDVAGQAHARGGGGRAVDPAAAGVAAQPAGSVGDAGGTPASAAAAAAHGGAGDGRTHGHDERAEAPDRGAGEGPVGAAGLAAAHRQRPQAAEWAAGLDDAECAADAGGENRSWTSSPSDAPSGCGGVAS